MSRGRPRSYPWESWADGQVHDIRPGQDFDCSLPIMIGNLHRYGRAKAAMRVQTKVLGDGWVRFQYVPKLWHESGSVERPSVTGR